MIPEIVDWATWDDNTEMTSTGYIAWEVKNKEKTDSIYVLTENLPRTEHGAQNTLKYIETEALQYIQDLLDFTRDHPSRFEMRVKNIGNTIELMLHLLKTLNDLQYDPPFRQKIVDDESASLRLDGYRMVTYRLTRDYTSMIALIRLYHHTENAWLKWVSLEK